MANKTATKTVRLKITAGTLLTGEGALYEIYTEDGIAHVFDCWITVEAGGKTWMQPCAVKGYGEHGGVKFPNRNYRAMLNTLVTWIKEVGSINPAKWQEVDPNWAASQLADIWADDERFEREERRLWGR